MQKYDRAFRSAATKLANAARRTAQDLSARVLPDEPNFTASLTTRFRDALNRHSHAGISWSAKILTSHGPNTEEKEFGADFLGCLNLELPDYQIKKGFLAQAKLQEPGTKLSTADWGRLRNQCSTMLDFSSESFVFVYSLNGVFIIPAISVLACADREDLHTLHPKTVSAFYRDHFYCFVGESRIDTTDVSILEKLRFEKGIEITATAKLESSQKFDW